MSEPIFVLGCHRSGTSVVAGLLNRASGVSMGELMPPTQDNPMGYFEALGVVDAHRDLLAQMERDWTCPPSTFRPDLLDLSALDEQVHIHEQLPGVWAMKDPRSMFLLPAWSQLGVDRVRLVAVVRPPADTVRSIEKRDGIRQDRADAIVEAHLRRLVEIAEQVPLPVVRFPGDGNSLIEQVRELAASLDLPWDEDAARQLFDDSLVRNRTWLSDPSPTYDMLLETAQYPQRIRAVSLHSLELSSEPEWPLETHLAIRYAQHRNQLWEMAQFSTDPEPDVVEVLLEGARGGSANRPGMTVRQVEVNSLLEVGSVLMKNRLRPHGLVSHGLLAGRPNSDIEYFFRSAYLNTDPLAELVIDTPDPQGEGLLSARPAHPAHPRPQQVKELADQCGWDHIVTDRLSPGRSGMLFRKRILTDTELIPVVTDLIAGIQRIHAIDRYLALGEEHPAELESLDHSYPTRDGDEYDRMLETERKRADDAELALDRLRSRRSVRLALALSRPFRRTFQMVRSWRKRG